MESTTQLVNETFVFVMLFIACTVTYAVLSHRRDEDGPTNGRRLLDVLAARYLIPSSDADAAVREVVRVPVTEPPANQYDDAPEFDITQPLAQEQLIRLLCYQIDEKTGKLYSANKIADFIGGTRADVLAVVREERSGEKPQPYQAEPVTPRKLEFARTLPDGKVVRVDQWGVEWVQQENQLIPVDMYIAHFLTPQAA